MIRPEALGKIQQEIEKLSAAQVADMLLSPYVPQNLLNDATAEQGPSMWIVNRSDVYTATLEKLAHHSIPGIASRAREKITARGTTLTLLSPPEVPPSFEEVEEHSVEDLLGHPLCPFEGMIYFSRSLNEDHRGSAALSLTRRLLEHPPNWSIAPHVKIELQDHFSRLLLEDPSPFVRAYTARIPILPTSVISEALLVERDDFVRGKILQNPDVEARALERAAQHIVEEKISQFFSRRVLAFDERLSSASRVALMKVAPADSLSEAIHEWFLSCS